MLTVLDMYLSTRTYSLLVNDARAKRITRQCKKGTAIYWQTSINLRTFRNIERSIRVVSDEESDTASIMLEMAALIEEDTDEEEEVGSSTEKYFDPLTHSPGPTIDDHEEPRYSQRKRRPTQLYGGPAHAARRSG